MSDSQTTFSMIWDRAARAGGPFEIDEILPSIVARIGKSDKETRRVVSFLLDELGRMPDGRQYFRQEGRAIVSLPEFSSASARGVSPLDAYPFEL